MAYSAPFRNVTSTPNSSTTPLASSATFTGSWEDVSDFSDVVVALASDQPCTYTIQFSPDGTNQDSTLTRYHKSGEINAPHRFTITRKFVRITVTNTGSSAQTYMRLQTTFGHRHPLNVPLDGTVAQDYDATCTRPTNFAYEAALSKRQGTRTFSKFGYNTDVDTGGTETIWASGGSYTVPTTAETLNISSGNTADDGDPAGTGAHNVYIYGIDENRKYQTETVTLNGTGTVTTTGSWLGINRMVVGSAGTGLTNAGTITAVGSSSSAVFATIPAGESVTQQCIYHTQLQSQVLADWLLINCLKVGVGSTPVVTVKGWIYSPVSNCRYEVFRLLLDTAVENTVEIRPTQPFVFNPGDVFYLTASTTVDNTSIAARFSLIEFQNNIYDPNS